MKMRRKFAAGFVAATIAMSGVAFASPTVQSSENVRSQAEKRLEQQRKDLTRNWQG